MACGVSQQTASTQLFDVHMYVAVHPAPKPSFATHVVTALQ